MRSAWPARPQPEACVVGSVAVAVAAPAAVAVAMPVALALDVALAVAVAASDAEASGAGARGASGKANDVCRRRIWCGLQGAHGHREL